MKSAAILFAALLTAHPDPVLAGSTCGGSSGGDHSSSSSSSDSSSSSSDSSSSSSSSPVTPACHDSSDVVGYRECTRFGAWAANMRLPIILIELGTAMRAMPSLAGNHGGTITHADESFAYRTIDAPETGLDRQVVSTARIGVATGSGVFFATDLEIGSVVAPARAGTEMTGTGVFGSPTVTQGGGLAFNLAAVTGIRRAIGRGRLSLEAAGGVRTVQYKFESNYHNCETSTTVGAAAPLVELRAGYEHWLTPFISAGATVGTSVIDRGTWMGGLHFGFHSRAFAGSR